MKTICPLIAVLALTGCETVEMQYTDPAPQGNFDAVEAQANEHYEYFVFPKTYILVTPIAEVTGKQTPVQEQSTAGNNKEQNKSTGKTSNVKTKAGTTVEKKKEPSETPSKEATPSPPSLSNGLATAVIDGRKWEAKVVQLPDDSQALAVKGVSGFWKSTAVGITKYQNTDMVSSISTKAENLVPKRLGQIASVVATAMQIGALGVSSDTSGKAVDLESFVADISKSSGRINSDWTYTFYYDSPTPPAGTVTLQSFKDKAMNRKVPYWPVPACRSATLVIIRDSDNSKSAFHVTVSNLDAVRLQPLSIDGKLELGSTCSATVSGATTADGFSTFSDDFQAVKQLIETIKASKKPTDADVDTGQEKAPSNAKK